MRNFKSVSIVVAIFLFILCVIYAIYKLIIPSGENSVTTVIAALMGSLVSLSAPFIADLLKKLKGKYRTEILVKHLESNMVLFSSSIENVGDKDILIKVANLYIDQGIPRPKGSKVDVGKDRIQGALFYDFPFLLKHAYPTRDSKCILCKKCKEKELNYPTGCIEERFDGLEFYHANIELKHLTKESVTYISPRERYSEDVILQFKNSGVYRVTLVVISEGRSCQCATKQFYIPDKSSSIEDKKKK